MNVYYSNADVPRNFGPSVVTVGNFDGVHRGHAEIMRRVVEIGTEQELTPTVLTFDPHPARVLAAERAPKLIMTIAQRLRRLEELGIQAVLVLPFSLDFARLSPEEFAQRILAETLHARCVLVGEDFRFGYRQSGTIETLAALGKRNGFEFRPVLAITGGGDRVSSTRIRSFIEGGRVSKACRLLGTPFALEGNVVSGHGIGSKQTVPTLNLAPENELLPKVGVYATRTRAEGAAEWWPSITNVGCRPTFDGQELTVETFLLEPPPAQTPRRIEVQFLAFVRDERKFESPIALREQILRDAASVRRFHHRINRVSVG